MKDDIFIYQYRLFGVLIGIIYIINFFDIDSYAKLVQK